MSPARRRPRAWEAGGDDDPGAGLVNLFDVWIAFAVALLLALVGYLQRPSARADAQADLAAARKTERFRPTDAPITGNGTRLGTAYRLASGEVVYVPDGAKP